MKLEVVVLAERLWAVGDVTGLWPLRHAGEHQGEIMAANMLGGAREANYDAVPRAGRTDPQAAAVGATSGPLDVLTDTIQPFPTLSEIDVEALRALRRAAVPGTP